jgi:hypothetical protein
MQHQFDAENAQGCEVLIGIINLRAEHVPVKFESRFDVSNDQVHRELREQRPVACSWNPRLASSLLHYPPPGALRVKRIPASPREGRAPL